MLRAPSREPPPVGSGGCRGAGQSTGAIRHRTTLSGVVTVSVADDVTEELLGAVHRLLPQLSASAQLPGGPEVGEIVNSPATVLFVARDELAGDQIRPDDAWQRDQATGAAGHAGGPGQVGHAGGPGQVGHAGGPGQVGHAGPIVGMLTLAIFRIPTGIRAWVEDVVVDGASRGRGVGEALTQAAVAFAGARGALTVDLTSRASREAANRLYQRIGFELRDTNVYRLKLGTSAGGASPAGGGENRSFTS